ncbi:MAG: hypothetical protein Q8K85_00520, partial [Hyphomicrobium sp.]|nr:hypothetical protein [Hyphomicrobium sp.]
MTGEAGRAGLTGLVVENAALVGRCQRRPVAVERLEELALILVPPVDVPQVVLQHGRREAAAASLDL